MQSRCMQSFFEIAMKSRSWIHCWSVLDLHSALSPTCLKLIAIPDRDSIDRMEPKQYNVTKYCVWQINMFVRQASIFVHQPLISATNSSPIMARMWGVPQVKNESTDRKLNILNVCRFANKTREGNSIGKDNHLCALSCWICKESADGKNDHATHLCSCSANT